MGCAGSVGMKHLRRTGLVVAIAGLLSGQGAIQPIPIPPQVATKTFTPLTLYFVDPVSGSDGANGLSVANAWKTPNHTVHCGDVSSVKKPDFSSGRAEVGERAGREFGATGAVASGG